MKIKQYLCPNKDNYIMKIAVILTVHNRKVKTLSCLQHLFAATDSYNHGGKKYGSLSITVFLTDDGCTDGTVHAIKDTFPKHMIHILQGNGKMYWAGGMRLAWQAAINEGIKWDYYLLLNDDTNVHPNVFQELFYADNYSLSHYYRRGICSGLTCSPENSTAITYGGVVFATKSKGRQILLLPTGTPQMADMTNANILLVHHSVVTDLGIFHDGFRHGCADYDYSFQSRKRNIPVLVTSHVCGDCEHDHESQKEEIMRLIDLSLQERCHYVKNPIHSDSDYLLFVKRNMPFRYPQALLMRFFRIYCPRIYYYLTSVRGIYK